MERQDFKDKKDTLSILNESIVNDAEGAFFRKFRENNYIDLSGSETIESADDVAFIFDALKDEAVENSFAVYVKDKKATVVHLSIGTANRNLVDPGVIALAAAKIQPDEIYFVHNHPSGNVQPSIQDINIMQTLRKMSEENYPVHGIIINGFKGIYSLMMDGDYDAVEKKMREDGPSEKVRIYSADKRAFNPEYQCSDAMHTPQSIVDFMYSHRLGKRNNINVLMLDGGKRCVGNLCLPFADANGHEKEIAEKAVVSSLQFDAKGIIIFGNANIVLQAEKIQGLVKDLSAGSIQTVDAIHISETGFVSALEHGLLMPFTQDQMILAERDDKIEEVEDADDIEIEEYKFTPSILENGVIDYTEIKHDKIYLSNKKDILTKPRPEWIPDLDEGQLKSIDWLPPCMKAEDGNYYVSMPEKTRKIYPGEAVPKELEKQVWNFEAEINMPFAEFCRRRNLDALTIIPQSVHKMSLDVLTATIDYYMKRAQEKNKQNGIKEPIMLPKKMKSMKTERYSAMRSLMEYIPEYSDKAEMCKAYPWKSKDSNFKEQKRIIFGHYDELLEKIRGKKLDLNLQKQDFINTHAKDAETAYGDSNLNDSLLSEYGVKIKKQNGSAITEREIKSITENLESVSKFYGGMTELSATYGLKISYADNVHQHARDAIGLFSPYFHAIGISYFNDADGRKGIPSMIMAHETAHWLDHLKGMETYYPHASDKTGTLENKIAEEFKHLVREHNKKETTSKSLGKYWLRTCECFARAEEEAFAIENGIENVLENDPAYLPKDVFMDNIMPLVQELNEQNREHFGLEETAKGKETDLNEKELNNMENEKATEEQEKKQLEDSKNMVKTMSDETLALSFRMSIERLQKKDENSFWSREFCKQSIDIYAEGIEKRWNEMPLDEIKKQIMTDFNKTELEHLLAFRKRSTYHTVPNNPYRPGWVEEHPKGVMDFMEKEIEKRSLYEKVSKAETEEKTAEILKGLSDEQIKDCMELMTRKQFATEEYEKIGIDVANAKVSEILKENERRIIAQKQKDEKNKADTEKLMNLYADEKKFNKAVANIELADFVSIEDNRLFLQGIYHEDGYEVATDARMMAVIRKEYPSELEKKIIRKNGEEITDCLYPNWKRINVEEKPEWNRTKEVGDIDSLIKRCLVGEAIGEKDREDKRRKGHNVAVRVGKSWFLADRLLPCLCFAKKCNLTEIYQETNGDILHDENGNIMKDDNGNYLKEYDENLDRIHTIKFSDRHGNYVALTPANIDKRTILIDENGILRNYEENIDTLKALIGKGEEYALNFAKEALKYFDVNKGDVEFNFKKHLEDAISKKSKTAFPNTKADCEMLASFKTIAEGLFVYAVKQEYSFSLAEGKTSDDFINPFVSDLPNSSYLKRIYKNPDDILLDDGKTNNPFFKPDFRRFCENYIESRKKEGILVEKNFFENNFKSNLSKDEQEYINSPEFIEKFGDWKKSQRLEKLKASESLSVSDAIVVDGVNKTEKVYELRKNYSKENLKELQDIANDIGKEILKTYREKQGIGVYSNPKFTNKDTGKEFFFQNMSIKEIKHHNLFQVGHIESIQAIPEIIENAIYIGEEDNQDLRNPQLKKFYYFGCGIKINNENYTCKAVFTLNDKNELFYDQSLSTIEKGRFVDIVNEKNKPDAFNPQQKGWDSNELYERNMNPFDYYDKRLINICQVPQMPYLDENLEPTKEAIQAVKEGKLFITEEKQNKKIVYEREIFDNSILDDAQTTQGNTAIVESLKRKEEMFRKEEKPYIRLNWSERSDRAGINYDNYKEGQVYDVKEFNDHLMEMDRKTKESNDGYYKAHFDLCNVPNIFGAVSNGGIVSTGKIEAYENPVVTSSVDFRTDRYDIGDGDGSLFSFIRKHIYGNPEAIEALDALEESIYFPNISISDKLKVKHQLDNVSEENIKKARKEFAAALIAKDEKLKDNWMVDANEINPLEDAEKTAREKLKVAYEEFIDNATKAIIEIPVKEIAIENFPPEHKEFILKALERKTMEIFQPERTDYTDNDKDIDFWKVYREDRWKTSPIPENIYMHDFWLGKVEEKIKGKNLEDNSPLMVARENLSRLRKDVLMAEMNTNGAVLGKDRFMAEKWKKIDKALSELSEHMLTDETAKNFSEIIPPLRMEAITRMKNNLDGMRGTAMVRIKEYLNLSQNHGLEKTKELSALDEYITKTDFTILAEKAITDAMEKAKGENVMDNKKIFTNGINSIEDFNEYTGLSYSEDEFKKRFGPSDWKTIDLHEGEELVQHMFSNAICEAILDNVELSASAEAVDQTVSFADELAAKIQSGFEQHTFKEAVEITQSAAEEFDKKYPYVEPGTFPGKTIGKPLSAVEADVIKTLSEITRMNEWLAIDSNNYIYDVGSDCYIDASELLHDFKDGVEVNAEINLGQLTDEQRKTWESLVSRLEEKENTAEKAKVLSEKIKLSAWEKEGTRRIYINGATENKDDKIYIAQRKDGGWGIYSPKDANLSSEAKSLLEKGILKEAIKKAIENAGGVSFDKLFEKAAAIKAEKEREKKEGDDLKSTMFSSDKIEIKSNYTKQGYEVKFIGEEDQKIVASLLEHGFKRSEKQQMYYAKNTEELGKYIEHLVEEQKAEINRRYVNKIERGYLDMSTKNRTLETENEALKNQNMELQSKLKEVNGFAFSHFNRVFGTDINSTDDMRIVAGELVNSNPLKYRNDVESQAKFVAEKELESYYVSNLNQNGGKINEADKKKIASYVDGLFKQGLSNVGDFVKTKDGLVETLNGKQPQTSIEQESAFQTKIKKTLSENTKADFYRIMPDNPSRLQQFIEYVNYECAMENGSKNQFSTSILSKDAAKRIVERLEKENVQIEVAKLNNNGNISFMMEASGNGIEKTISKQSVNNVPELLSVGIISCIGHENMELGQAYKDMGYAMKAYETGKTFNEIRVETAIDTFGQIYPFCKGDEAMESGVKFSMQSFSALKDSLARSLESGFAMQIPLKKEKMLEEVLNINLDKMISESEVKTKELKNALIEIGVVREKETKGWEIGANGIQESKHGLDMSALLARANEKNISLEKEKQAQKTMAPVFERDGL